MTNSFKLVITSVFWVTKKYEPDQTEPFLSRFSLFAILSASIIGKTPSFKFWTDLSVQ